jgi:hypothetical protein
MPLRRLRILLPILCALAAAAEARADSQVCDAAAAAAAAETGVPLPILMAIARAESGRAPDGDPGADPAPWPWTLNAGGTGAWFATRAAALARAEALREEGETNFDLGCFQISHHWHAAAFPSLDAMLDPMANARYAAGYLAALHAETGDWRAAAAAYHSRDPARAEAYVRRLEALHAGGRAAEPATAAPAPQAAAFSLTRATGALLTGARGPLVGAP